MIWCGECFISCPVTIFYLNKSKDLKERGNNKKDRARTCWGKEGQRPHDYLRGRDGDHCLIPFECNLYIFYKLCFSNPNPKSDTDNLNMEQGCANAEGLQDPAHERPLQIKGFLEHDYCRYEVTIAMLLYSRNKGTNNNHFQYNFLGASTQGASRTYSILNVKGCYKRLVAVPCESLWFHKRQMVQDWRPNQAMGLKCS